MPGYTADEYRKAAQIAREGGSPEKWEEEAKRMEELSSYGARIMREVRDGVGEMDRYEVSEDTWGALIVVAFLRDGWVAPEGLILNG